MPRHNFYKVAPLVRSLCKKHGVTYTIKSLPVAFGDILRLVEKINFTMSSSLITNLLSYFIVCGLILLLSLSVLRNKFYLRDVVNNNNNNKKINSEGNS